MFSGIQSLLFGKKHKVKQDDSLEDRPQSSIENDFVILERRHSGDFDKNSGLYPSLDPSKPDSSNLPYSVSPSLPNLNNTSSNPLNKKDVKIDMLQAVPFVLSPEILLFDEHDKKLSAIIDTLNEMKESEEGLLDNFNYDFELEHSVSVQFS